MKYEWVPIGDVLELQRRQVEIHPLGEYAEIGLRSFGKGIFHKNPRYGEALGDKRVFRIAAEDLIVSNVFGWEGAVAVAQESEEGLIGSHRFMTWTPRRDDIDVHYVSHFLLSDGGMHSLRKASPGSAGRNRTLSIKNFEAITIPLPSMDDQRKVASWLDRIARVAVALPPVSESERRSTLLRNRLFDGVQGSRRPIGDLLTLQRRGVMVETDSEYREVGLRAYGRGVFHKPPITGNQLGRKRVFHIHPGDLLVSNVFGWEGSIAVAGSAEAGLVGSHRFMTWTSIGPEVDTRFVCQYLLTDVGLDALRRASPGSAGRNRTLSIVNFEAINVPCPSREIQAGVVSSMNMAMRIQELANRRATLGSALLPAARNEVFSQFT